MSSLKMERWILFLLCVSGIFITLNPVYSSTTVVPTTNNSTSKSITESPTQPAAISASTSISTEPSTTSQESATSSNSTTSTTTPTPTTTQPPVDISGNCTNSSKCGNNAYCKNGTCECKYGFYQINKTDCDSVNDLIVTDLHVTSSNESSISVAWSAPSINSNINYVLEYYIEISSIGSNRTISENQTTFNDLMPGMQYNISVKTVLNVTVHSPEEVITEWTKPNSPECPDLRNSYNSPNITVNWTKPDGNITGYIVTFNGEEKYVRVESINIPDVKPGRNYSLELQSCFTLKNGTVLNSTSVNCTIRIESETPEEPNNVTAITKTSTNITLQIVPTDNPNGVIEKYYFQLFRRYYIDEEFTNVENKTLNVTVNNKYTLFPLTEGAYYYILVFTVNDGFTSSEHFNVSNIRLEEGVPGEIVNKSYISFNESVEVHWNRPKVPGGDVIGYRLQITHINGSCDEYTKGNITNNENCTNIQKIPDVAKNKKQLNQLVKFLEPYQNYTVAVWAYTSIGQGKKYTFTVMTSVAAPYKPGIACRFDINSTYVAVCWSKPLQYTGPTTYTVFTHDVILNKNANRTCRAKGFDQTNCKVENLRPFWKYKFRVTAETDAGTNESDSSEEVLTEPSKPGEVAKLSATLQEKRCQLTLMWSTPIRTMRRSNVTQYWIYTDSTSEVYHDLAPEPFEADNKEFTIVITLHEKEKDKVAVWVAPFGETVGKSNSQPKKKYIVISECYEPLSALEIVGIVICVMLLCVLLVFVGIIAFKRREQIEKFLTRRRRHSGEFEPLQPPIERNRTNPQLRPRCRIRKRPIVLSDITHFLNKYHADDNRLFIAEYEDLKALSPKHPTNAANLDENKPKNRYTNILPYDHSRVILAPTDDEESSDYINANYIPGYTYGKEFIASQGPLPGTANDFWRMVWEQSVSIVVMLTKCKENNMHFLQKLTPRKCMSTEDLCDKCEHYWPDDVNEPKCYDDLMVNVTSISNMDKYDIHVMDLCFGDEKRVVKHFHFLEWPDFSAKVETTTLIDFISTVRSHITPDIKGPTITHCSAGVGRTGTFITVDFLMQFVRDHDFSSQVDIFDWVLNMRDHRTTMVQTMTQYAFIHDCLADLVERKKQSLQTSNGDIEIAIDNPAFEPDDLYENTKLGVDPKTEL